VSETEANFKVDDVDTNVVSGMKMYFDVGVPYGRDIVSASLTLEPKLVSVSPNVGSAGGTLITAKVAGLGKKQLNVDIVNAVDDVSICSKVTIEEYGKVQCLTKIESIPTGTELKVKIGDVFYSCSNTDTTKCVYEQLLDAAFPIVTALAKSAEDKIDFTGTDFILTGFKAEAWYAGIKATSVDVTDATSASATWEHGVPLSADAISPILKFVEDTSKIEYYSQLTETLINAIDITASSTGLTCSFAGGCNLEMTAAGLTSMLNLKDTNYISVCG